MRLFSLTLCLSLAISAHADEQQVKIDFLEKQFQHNAEHSRAWQYGWLGFLSTATLVQGIGANVVDDDKLQYDMSVGTVTSFLGAADLLMNPMPSHNFSQQLSAMKVNDESQKQAKLAQAEAWLAKAAAREAQEKSWTTHFLSTFVNALAGLAVAYDDKRPIDGWLTFASGVAVSQFKIYTAPTHMMEAQQAYQSGNYNFQAAKTEQNRWQLAAAGPNLSINWRF
jgi:hypothetical protein